MKISLLLAAMFFSTTIFAQFNDLQGDEKSLSGHNCKVTANYKSGKFSKKDIVTYIQAADLIDCITATEAQLGNTLEDSPWYTAENLNFTVQSAEFTFEADQRLISGRIEKK